MQDWIGKAKATTATASWQQAASPSFEFVVAAATNADVDVVVDVCKTAVGSDKLERSVSGFKDFRWTFTFLRQLNQRAAQRRLYVHCAASSWFSL